MLAHALLAHNSVLISLVCTQERAGPLILVDDRPTPGRRGLVFYHMATDNLAAGGLDELFGVAERLGLRRHWIHDRPRLPHFDVPHSVKRAALALGAVEVSTQGVGAPLPQVV